MNQGRIIVITGSPGTGKTTTASIVAKESDMDKSVHMHTDDFFHYLSKGAIPPHLPESNEQNLVVIEAFLEAAKRYARGGYDVIVDGIVGPWFLEPWKALVREHYEVHYIILRARATKILGIDLSKKMIEEAQKRNSGNQIEYRISGLEEYDYPENEWDCVISNLALHYIEDIVEIFQKVYRTLKPGGIFLFNIEHPVFTAGVGQDWIYTDDGKPQYWAIDNYFITGERNTHFLGCDVVKQHHTLTQIIMGLLNNGFELKVVEEAEPPKEMMDIPGMEDELRRPMMLLVKAIAKK